MDTNDKRKIARQSWDRIAFEMPFYEAAPGCAFCIEVGISVIMLQFYNVSEQTARAYTNSRIETNNLPKPNYIQSHTRLVDGWEFITLTIDLDNCHYD